MQPSNNYQRLRVVFTFYMLIGLISLNGQNTFQLTGSITDEYNHPLVGAAILLQGEDKGTATDRKGNFTFNILTEGNHELVISFLGYKTQKQTITLNKNKHITIQLISGEKELDEITVTENAVNTRKAESSMNVEVIDKNFVNSNLSGSLMQTLNRLPGISSMDIGAGQSKPVIRGLGFSRVAVAENSIKHEAQEWGADHGLEIDQFTVEQIEVIKGPASLMYGANAIGGVIDLKEISTPAKNSTGGSLLLNMHTNNNLLGVSAKFHKRFDKFYFKTHFTYTDYSDYRVPTDSISYMSYYFRLKNNQLRNTAGMERNGSITLGYLNNNFASHLTFSDNFSKSGFFANAHGLEIRNSTIDYDRSDRDIDLPSQQVNHFKILSNTIWMIKDYKLKTDLGFQNNYRQEFAEAISHGYMPTPPDSLERLYNKNTWTANVKLELPVHNIHHWTAGINSEFQNNKIDGWGFIIPAFRSYSGGAFVYDNIHFSEKWIANAGVRYDLGGINTDAYYDWYNTRQDDGSEIEVQRATQLHRTFGNFSWGIGATRKTRDLILKINLGKSFRMPTAKELASNGINYHMYRYEKGDTALKAEESYQLDVGLTLKKKNWNIELSPFVNYFPNYIYLNPTSEYYEAQQIYYYNQSKVFRTGGEIAFNYDITRDINFSADAEYIYSLQLSGEKKGYTLPFSPPLTSNVEIKYSPQSKGIFKNPTLGINLKLVTAQNNIVPPEKKTAGYSLLGFNAGTNLKIGKQTTQLNMQLTNVLNTRYYDHTSFYRLIEVPGQGRNFIVTLQIPFGN
ncbi:MAG: TonB-dependent receptor [Paludibacter sp.]|nr:TonB-dependent receptor [Paludibacter sp.]